MRQLTIAISGLIMILFFASCIKQVDVATRNVKPILVVEGSITTDTVPYTVKLTYSGKLSSATDIPDESLEKDAVVTITDDLGNATLLTYMGAGNYQTTDTNYIGQVGRSYHVNVKLTDGKTFVSIPEKIGSPVPVANINVSFASHFSIYYPSRLNISIDVQDPPDQENYYKWDFYSWILRQTNGVPCGFGCLMYEYCYQKHIDKEVRLLSDNSINGNKILNQEVGYSYIYTFGDHFIDISQTSLTREAYQFWQRYNEQLTRTGSILDPLPASIRGNVYNETDPDDFALGYFFASSITHRRAVLVPYSITQYWLGQSAAQFIPPGSVACFDFFPDALFYPPPPAKQYPAPAGWENAEKIKVYW